LTTTQRMKEFRTAHSESVVKERERNTTRPIYQNCCRPIFVTGILLPSEEGWLAIRSPFNCPTSLLVDPSIPTLGAS